MTAPSRKLAEEIASRLTDLQAGEVTSSSLLRIYHQYVAEWEDRLRAFSTEQPPELNGWELVDRPFFGARDPQGYVHPLPSRFPENRLQEAEAERNLLAAENEELRGLAERWNAELAGEFPPTKGGCPDPVFIARQLRAGASYDGESGLWWTSEDKPGVLRQTEQERDRLAAELLASQGREAELRETLLAIGVCEGCGESVIGDHRSGGSWGHTRSEHASDCQGDCTNCPVPVSCGPIRPLMAGHPILVSPSPVAEAIGKVIEACLVEQESHERIRKAFKDHERDFGSSRKAAEYEAASEAMVRATMRRVEAVDALAALRSGQASRGEEG